MNDKTDAATTLQRFLDHCGLGQYFGAMVGQDLDFATLKDLDDADFRELGLTIGHRKILKHALKTYVEEPDQGTEAQRRQVTIVFCDLVSSTELAGRYDAEDMAEILERYHQHTAQVIQSWGGLSLGTQGDGVVACFGYPKASENDAEHAVSAALALSKTVPELVFDDDLVLHTRIGVSTGRVFIRGRVADSSALVGDTFNLASRLQDSAPVDGVVTGASTHRLISTYANTEFLDDMKLKGFETPVGVWRINAVRDYADRQLFIADASPQSQTAMMGRGREMAQITALWETAKTGKGQALILSGGAGIGKSHMAEAAKFMAQKEGATVLRYFCAPGYENSALYPIRGEITRRAGLRNTAPDQDVVAKLKAFAGTDDPIHLRLLADLLAIGNADALPPLDMTATEQKQATYGILAKQMLHFAAQGPILIMLEDVHWADPSTLELLTHTVAQNIPDQPILLIVTTRPASGIDLGAHDHVSKIKLKQLGRKDSTKIIKEIMGDRVCPPDVLYKIIEASDGIPLFLEELSQTVLEQQAGLDGKFSAVSVPITLEDSLMARLDRLAKGKLIVQTAAVFGRRFETPSLRKVMSLEEAQFSASLAEPVEARILLSPEGGSNDVMLFRHALVQQAAYEGLARKQRQYLHDRIATLLIDHYPSLADTEPETLARHFAGAGKFDEAITFLIAAGKMATARAAQIEAANHYFAALDHLTNLPKGRDRDEQEVLLQALLGGALMATRGFAAPEVYDAFARARDLCLALEDNPMYCACLYGLFTVAASRSNKEEAMALAQEMFSTFNEYPVPSWSIAAHFTMGVARFFSGHLADAEAHFDHVIAHYTPDQHEPLVEQFGDNLAEFSMCYRHWVHMMRGEFDQSAAVLARAEKMANDLKNKNAQTRSIAFRMGRQMELEDVGETATLASTLIEISTVQGYPYWASAGHIGLGWSMARQGQAEGTAPIIASLGFFDMIGQRNPQTYWRAYLINALIALDQRREALEATAYALDLSHRGLDSAFEPAILLCQGEAQMLSPADPTAAEASFRAALEKSLDLGAHLYTFRIALALAELLISLGRQSEEGGFLAEAMDRIESSTDFTAMQRARKVLKDL